jgi:large subunit ribosomal protein L25
MRTVSLFGKKRDQKGSSNAKALRREGFVPCIIYGNDENILFYAFINDFNNIIHNPETPIVDINLEGEHHRAVIQEHQFHPLSDELLHVDFLEISDEKPVKVNLPVKVTGSSEGVRQGGKLVLKARKLTVRGNINDLPQYIEVDISNLGLGKSLRVKDIKENKFEILSQASLPVAMIDVPRTAKGKEATA